MARSKRDIEIDDRELRELELDLRGAPMRMQFGVTRILETRGGPMLADAMKADAKGHRYLPKLPDAVTHEMLDKYTVEAGLEPQGKRNQGSLAHIIVYGSVNNAPVYDHMTGPRRVLPRIRRMFEDLVEDAVLGDEQK